MTTTNIVHPPVVGCDEWLEGLKYWPEGATKARDALNASRRRLPMVKLEKDYRFVGPDGEVKFADLFEGRRQLVIYHFMFDPRWDEGCGTCTGYINGLTGFESLYKRDATFALVSRAPYAKLAAWKERQGWSIPWYSSFGSDFNYDFHVTFDDSVAPTMHNFRPVTIPKDEQPGEGQGLSVFFRLGDDVFRLFNLLARRRRADRASSTTSTSPLRSPGRLRGFAPGLCNA
ncbi:MAG: DUF899 family protein [Thermomicrobiales bacterium]